MRDAIKLRATRHLSPGLTKVQARSCRTDLSPRLLHLSQPCSVAALAFHDLVALLEQALAFAILARGFLLDFGAFFIGHDGLRGGGIRTRAADGCAFSV